MPNQFFNTLLNKAKSVFNRNTANATVTAMTGGAIKPGSSNMMMTFTYVIFAVILIIIGYSIYVYYIKPSLKTNSMNTAEVYNETSGNTNQAELILFYVDWCPHCKTAKPEWEKVKSQYNGKIINGYTVIFTEVNCTTETPQIQQMVDQYKIEGYPTIKLIKGNQVVDFDAKPTQQSLTQFLNSVI
jgi:thiol-disulfide isomerase/thioredoxin